MARKRNSWHVIVIRKQGPGCKGREFPHYTTETRRHAREVARNARAANPGVRFVVRKQSPAAITMHSDGFVEISDGTHVSSWQR